MKVSVFVGCLLGFGLLASSAAATLRVETKDMDGTAIGQNWRRLGLLVTNQGSAPVDMSDVTLAYQMARENEPLEGAVWYYSVRTLDWSVQGGNISEVSIDFSEQLDHTNMVVTFGPRELPANGQMEVQLGVHQTDWGNIDETADPSYIGSSAYTENPKVEVSLGGCPECTPDRIFDLHFIVFDDLVSYGPSGGAITDADLDAEVENLNQTFVTEDGFNPVRFRRKSSVFVHDGDYIADGSGLLPLGEACVRFLECHTPYQARPTGQFELTGRTCNRAAGNPQCGVDGTPDTVDCNGDGDTEDRDDCVGVFEKRCKPFMDEMFTNCRDTLNGVPVLDHTAINVVIRGGYGNNTDCTASHVNLDAEGIPPLWDPLVTIDYRRMPYWSASAHAYFQHEMGHAFGLAHVGTCFRDDIAVPSFSNNIMEGNGVECPTGYTREGTTFHRNIGFYRNAPTPVPEDTGNADLLVPIQEYFSYVKPHFYLYQTPIILDMATMIEQRLEEAR